MGDASYIGDQYQARLAWNVLQILFGIRDLNIIELLSTRDFDPL